MTDTLQAARLRILDAHLARAAKRRDESFTAGELTLADFWDQQLQQGLDDRLAIMEGES